MKQNKERLYQIITIIAVILTIFFSIYIIFSGRQYFHRRGIRQLTTEIRQFGIWTPIALSGLIIANNLIPPLPIPVPVIEVVAGVIFGFWPGFLLVWISQIISSIFTFYMSRNISNLFFKKFIENKFFSFYNQFIEKRGALAVFVIRAAMIAPINIGFLAGLSKMSSIRFITANALGVISESVIFTYLGVLIIEKIHFRLWNIFAILIVLSVLPSLIFLMIRFFRGKRLLKTPH